MNTDLNQQELIERELTLDELAAISGGSEFTDFFKKIGDDFGEVGGVMIAGGYTVVQACKGMIAEMTGDLETAKDIQQNTMDRAEKLYNDVKDGLGTKVLGVVSTVGIVGAIAKGGKMAFDVIRTGIRPTDVRPVNPFLDITLDSIPSHTGNTAYGSPTGSFNSSFSFLEQKNRQLQDIFSAEQLQKLSEAGFNKNDTVYNYFEVKNLQSATDLSNQLGSQANIQGAFLEVKQETGNGFIIRNIPIITIQEVSQPATNEPKRENVGGLKLTGPEKYIAQRIS
ncbi:hypothetical protein [Synechococcus sp. PCC 6312]|uniref:hypothetical protein n=1 Tax=Synechococcus sp. (strain ATCC 27167 / PCC 6312) TaxID=195253 RepID=UPI00029EFDAD|nr:hypothetical protein [Synechococcus sp. PCC 6312]AFY60870.1 hypothetical protein Syn6312_1720 [Synechococcus sp. PCC 6312]